MGSDKKDERNLGKEFGSGKPWYLDEHPEHSETLPAFYLDKYEVTHAQYRDFVLFAAYKAPDYWTETGYVFTFNQAALDAAPEEILRKLAVGVAKIDMDLRKASREELLKVIKEHFAEYGRVPVSQITWQNAYDYCQWAGKRLPSEKEWEKAARGEKGQEYVWGAKWQAGWTNSGEEEWVHGAAPVGSYAKDKSPYGIYDMAGNVSEWVDGWYQAYPKSTQTSRMFGQKYRVARGGGWSGEGHYALELFHRGAYRLNLPLNKSFIDVGVRCAMDAP